MGAVLTYIRKNKRRIDSHGEPDITKVQRDKRFLGILGKH